MPIPNGVTRLVFSGRLASTAEKWAFGLWWNRGDGLPAFDMSSGEPTDAQYVALRTSLLTFLLPSDDFSALDVYQYHGGVADVHTQATFSHPGTSGNQPLPNQCALVLTLRTANASRRGRGRVYVPATGAVVVAGSRLYQATAVNALVDAMAAWMSQIEAVSPQTVPVVVSQTSGNFNTIISIDADTVPDTQRRRRNKLVAPRHSAPVSGD